VGRWIDDVHPGAHDRDGDSATEQRAHMRRRVDAQRKAADDDHASTGEVGPELLGDRLAVGRGAARTHDRGARAVGRRPASAGS